ncbi:MAG TPA: PadR family transcriptional regulator [Anaerolineaceae bacterium]|nr:PadR family transcriptional regulator [Anaerolineaceae bacterium]
MNLEHILLALLDQKPMHGYELYQELCATEGIDLIWNITQSLLYADLDKLEGMGMLSSYVIQGETYPPRKYFQITEKGKSSLQTWIRTPARRARDIRQEFLAKLIVARRYGTTQALELIRIQKQTCQTWLKELEGKVPQERPGQSDEWFVDSFRLMRVEGVLRWLKDCERAVMDSENQ